jgi:hypothetical protein
MSDIDGTSDDVLTEELKQRARLFAIIGEAVVQEAEKFPDFKSKLIEALTVVVTDKPSQEFLAARGWWQ